MLRHRLLRPMTKAAGSQGHGTLYLSRRLTCTEDGWNVVARPVLDSPRNGRIDPRSMIQIESTVYTPISLRAEEPQRRVVIIGLRAGILFTGSMPRASSRACLWQSRDPRLSLVPVAVARGLRFPGSLKRVAMVAEAEQEASSRPLPKPHRTGKLPARKCQRTWTV